MPLDKQFLATVFLAGVLAWCSVELGAAEKKPPELGQPAPPLSVEQWLEPKGASVSGWQNLVGQVVVVEFWATWCGPCVVAIPHLNELAEKFESRGVRFISITDEKEETVTKFLKRKPIKGWLALDPDESTFKAYGVRGIPLTAVVGPDGTLIALTSPQDLSDSALEMILAGDVAGARAKLPKPLSFTEIAIDRSEDAPPALFEVLVRPAPPKMMAQMSRNQWVLVGMELKGILASAYSVSHSRMVVPEDLGRTTYDVLVTVPPEKRGSLRQVAQQALETTLDLRVRRETREVDALVLSIPEGGAPPKLRAADEPGGSSWRSDRGEIAGTNMSIGSLADALESQMGQPVVDETGIEGKYDIELKWDGEKRETVFAAIREQLGLELREAKRPIEFTIFEAAAPANKP